MNREVFDKVRERAAGRCEACGRPFGESLELHGELDHFLGRNGVPETVETCWRLHGLCHREKTLNKPSASFWVRLFLAHCAKYEYREAEAMAMKKLDWLHSKAAFAK